METIGCIDEELAPPQCDRENCCVFDHPVWNEGDPILEDSGAEENIGQQETLRGLCSTDEDVNDCRTPEPKSPKEQVIEVCVLVELGRRMLPSFRALLLPMLLSISGIQQAHEWPDSIPQGLKDKAQRLILEAFNLARLNRVREQRANAILNCPQLQELTPAVIANDLALFPAFKEGFKFAFNVRYRAIYPNKNDSSNGRYSNDLFDDVWCLLVERSLDSMLALILERIDERSHQDFPLHSHENIRSFYAGLVSNGGASYLSNLFSEWSNIIGEARVRQAPPGTIPNNLHAKKYYAKWRGRYHLFDGFATLLAARCVGIENKEPVSDVQEMPQDLELCKCPPAA